MRGSSERPRQIARRSAWLPFAVSLWVGSSVAVAQVPSAVRPSRAALVEWDSARQGLYLSVPFRDVLDEQLLRKLQIGLPMSIILTGLLYADGNPQPLASSLQNCKITWHVWEEMYRIEVVRPNHPGARKHWTPTLNGVLRRCAEARRLLVADRTQLSGSQPLSFRAKVMVNPVSPELLQKIRRWISRPANTSAAPPGSILFSTFTGLFLTRIGEAERVLEFVTRSVVPSVAARQPGRER